MRERKITQTKKKLYTKKGRDENICEQKNNQTNRGVADGGFGGVLTPALYITGGSTPRKFRVFFVFSQMFMKNCVIFMSAK